VKKLDGLQRKFQRKLERMEQRQANQSQRLEQARSSNESGDPQRYNKYVNKLERKLAETTNKVNKFTNKVENVKEERAERANYLEKVLGDSPDAKWAISGIEAARESIVSGLNQVDKAFQTGTLQDTILQKLNEVDQLIQKNLGQQGKAPAPTEDKEPQCSIVTEEQPSVQDLVSQGDDQERKVDTVDMTVEPTEQPEPEQPKPVFQYQAELEQVKAMGFGSEEGVIVYLLTEHKGDTTKVVNQLLSSMS